MAIRIKWFDKDFNVELFKNEGDEPYLTIRGCRIVSGNDGEFIGWPATKNDRTGKWWRHVGASDDFADAVLAKARAGRPAGKRARGDDSDTPF